MKMHVYRTVLFAGLLISLVAAGEARAYDYAGQAWCCDTIYYYINPTNPSSACGSLVVGPWFQGRILAAAAVWNDQNTHFQLVNLGTTQTGCYSSTSPSVCKGYKDGQNTISMATSCNWVDDNIIAYSTWWYWTGGDTIGCVYESDICFNDGITWYHNIGGCSGTCYDLTSLAIHEIGHWIASNHENDNGTLGYKPIMYYSYNTCEMRRTVTADDSALLRWAYDFNGAIAYPARYTQTHRHPPYPAAPAHDECFECDPGVPDCASLTYDPCLLVCPASDIVWEIDVKDNCGDPVCALQSIWLDFSQCNGRACPGDEPDWPIVRPDSCNAATGKHYFSVDAGLRVCDFCDPILFVNGEPCRTLTGRFFDNNGDLQVTAADFVGGRVCEDYNCNYATDPEDQAIWNQHLGHQCENLCDCRVGDANSDGSVNVGDAVYMINYVFKGGPNPTPYAICSGDANKDCTANVGDAVYVINYVFKGGPAPCSCEDWLIQCGPPIRK